MRARRRFAVAMLGCVMTAGCAAGRGGPAEPREISVALTAPDAAWRIEISEVYLVDGELWVIAGLDRREGMAAQVLTTVSDAVRVEVPAGAPLRLFVTGKTWGWGSAPYTFIDGRGELPAPLENAQRIYPVPSPG